MARMLPFVTVLMIRKAAWPEFSGRETLAAASPRVRRGLSGGCPVVSVHFSFGLALHIGQRTDNICFNVSFSGFTSLVFSIANLRNGQFCSFESCLHLKPESSLSLLCFFQRDHQAYRNG